MSDSEGTIPVTPHASTGGKSLASLERPKYKSWRKKFRKMRTNFDGVLEDNKRYFKEEQKLEGIAKRLREELDGLLELCLDLNQNPALPPHQRFNISLPRAYSAVGSIPSVVKDDIVPEEANHLLLQYNKAVQNGEIPHMDLHVIREQIDQKLAKQGTTTLEVLESTIPHTVFSGHPNDLPVELKGDNPPGLLTSEQEDLYLLGLDARLGDQRSMNKSQERVKDSVTDDKNWVDLSPRELERQVELLNPQSQHNWLKRHAKPGGPLVADIDDTESQASHDTKPPRGGAKRNLAKQVGDRAVERAREVVSPGATSAVLGEEDELAFVDEHPGSSSKKRGRGDVDGTYRVKGGKGSGGGKGKRKRSGEDIIVASSAGKKAKTEAD